MHNVCGRESAWSWESWYSGLKILGYMMVAKCKQWVINHRAMAVVYT